MTRLLKLIVAPGAAPAKLFINCFKLKDTWNNPMFSCLHYLRIASSSKEDVKYFLFVHVVKAENG